MKTILLSAFIFCATILFSQTKNTEDYSYTIGKPFKYIEDGHSYIIENNIYLIRNVKKSVIIQKFDGESMNELGQTPLDIDFAYDSYFLKKINNRMFFFYQLWDKKAGNEQLFAIEVDLVSAKFIGTSKLLIQLDRKIVGGKFRLKNSLSNEVFMIWGRTIPHSKNDKVNKDQIGIYTFDKDLNNIISGHFTMPYTEAEMNNISYAVDGVGNAFILTEVLDDPTQKKINSEGAINYHLELIHIDTDNQVANTPFEKTDKHLFDLKFDEGTNNELTIVGFFSNEASRKYQDGIFFARIKSDNSLESSYFTFKKEILSKFYSLSKRQAKKEANSNPDDDVRLRNYQIRRVNREKDGSVTIYLEHYFVEKYRDSKTNIVTYTYHYNDILALKIDKNGENVWTNKFPKSQSGSTPLSLGFFQYTKDGYDYLIFMDSEGNENLTPDRSPSSYWSGAPGVLTVLKIDKETGEFERISTINFNENPKQILVRLHNQSLVYFDDKSFVFECSVKKYKSKVMMKVSVN